MTRATAIATIVAAILLAACSPEEPMSEQPTPEIVYVTPEPTREPAPIVVYVTPEPVATPKIVYVNVPPGACGPLDNFFSPEKVPPFTYYPCPK